jgi:hypothetical protein
VFLWASAFLFIESLIGTFIEPSRKQTHPLIYEMTSLTFLDKICRAAYMVLPFRLGAEVVTAKLTKKAERQLGYAMGKNIRTQIAAVGGDRRPCDAKSAVRSALVPRTEVFSSNETTRRA